MKRVGSFHVRAFGFSLVAFLILGVTIPLAPKSGPSTARASPLWWNPDWMYRKPLTVDHNQVSEDLADFPLLVSIRDADLASKAQQDGDDIAFVDAASGVKLSHEIESFDRATGKLVAWVRLPSLSATADTTIYMYYGNPYTGNQQNPQDVWDPNFVMVQHLEEPTGARYDSTSYGDNLSPYGGITKNPSGTIDGADAFDGSTAYERQTTMDLSGRNEIMIESWINVNSMPAVVRYSKTHMYGRSLPSPLYWYGLWASTPNTSPIAGFSLIVRLYNPASNKIQSFSQSVNTVDEWVHVAWGLSKLTKRTYFYVNGALLRSDDISSYLASGFTTPMDDTTVKGFSLGSNINGHERTRMAADEVRVSVVARSSGWILTSYNNQRAPSSFYSVGPEEGSSEAAPIVSDEKPRNGAVEVYTNPTLSAAISDPDGDLMTIVFRSNSSGAWRDLGSYSKVVTGTYSWIPTDMNQLGKRYFWSVSAYDGTSWTNKTYSFTTTNEILKLKWIARTDIPMDAGVLIADVNGDGREDVICAGKGNVTALNGFDGSPIWRVPVDGATKESKPEMADLNKDGVLEIVVPIQYPAGIHVLFSNNGGTYWRKTGLGGQLFSSPVIADIDADGYPEIFVATMWTLPERNDGVIASLSYNGTLLHKAWSWHPCDGGLSMADADNDGAFELYVGDRYMYYNDTLGLPLNDTWGGKGLRSLWAENLTVRWQKPDVMCSSHRPMLADVNRDGKLEVIVGHHYGGIAVYSANGNLIRRDLSMPKDAPIHYQPSISDIDGDGNLEILMADGSHSRTTNDTVVWDLAAWKPNGRIYLGNCLFGPQEADVTGDGKMEAIAANYTTVFVLDKDLKVTAQFKPSVGGWLTYAVVQDIDGDDYNEVVIASTSGRIIALDTPARRADPRPRSEVRFYSERRLGSAEYVPPPSPSMPIISAPYPQNNAVNVPVSLAQLRFKLGDFQNDPMSYTVTTNPNIGQSSGVNVPNGVYEVSVTGLKYETTYRWTVTATDGSHTSQRTFTFTTEKGLSWWNTNWRYRRSIGIDPARVSGDLTGFPALIDITDSGFTGKAQTDGDDFVFTDSSGNRLSHEIELYDSSSGRLIAWVRIPFLSSETDTRLFLYYGNPNANNQQSPEAVWASGYKMVLHLKEKTGVAYDSTANNNDGVPYGGVAQGSASIIDGGDSFDGTDDYLEAQHSNSLTGFKDSFSAGFWLKIEDVDRRQTILCKYNTVGNQRSWLVEYQNNAKYGKILNMIVSQDGINFREYRASFNPTIGEWCYVTVVWMSGKIPKFYVNGLPVSTVGSTNYLSLFNNTGVPLHIGKSTYTPDRYLSGSLDEIQISNPARSAEWIATSYNNQKSPYEFYTVGSEESLPG